MADEKVKHARGKKPLTKPIPELQPESLSEEIQNTELIDIPHLDSIADPLQAPLFHEIKPEGQGDNQYTEPSPELPEDTLPSKGHKQPPIVLGRVHGVRGEPERTPYPPEDIEPPVIKP